MFKKYLTLVLAILMFSLFSTFSAFAQISGDADSRSVLRIKSAVANAGTDPNRKIKVRLKDGAKLKGYITEIKDDHFAMFDEKSGKVARVDYAQVIEVKKEGVPKPVRVAGYAALGTGVVVGTLFVLALALSHTSDW